MQLKNIFFKAPRPNACVLHGFPLCLRWSAGIEFEIIVGGGSVLPEAYNALVLLLQFTLT